MRALVQRVASAAVSVDGEQVYSKLQTKRYPELSEIVKPVQEAVEKVGVAAGGG